MSTTADWFVPDNILMSYVLRDYDYTCNYNQEELKWFNFNLSTPAETEQEAREREIATRQQIQLGILKVAPAPQQTQQSAPIQNNQNVQPPQHALDPNIAKAMECRITPAFICMLDGKPVDLQTVAPQISNSQPTQQKQKTTIESLAEQFVSKVDNNQKYKFSLQGKKKIGPNEPCPCGSNLKFKKCHGR